MNDEVQPSINPEYPTIISFYTVGDNDWEEEGKHQFKEYADRLRQNCIDLGLDHHIVELEDTGEWLENTRRKPRFILDTIQKLQRPILWLDCDGSIYQMPDLFKGNVEFDLALPTNTWNKKRQWHVATIYANTTPMALNLLTTWADYMGDDRFDWSDELGLEVILHHYTERFAELNILALNAKYHNYYKTLDQKPNEETVIGHRSSMGMSKFEFNVSLRDREGGLPEAADYLKDME